MRKKKMRGRMRILLILFIAAALLGGRTALFRGISVYAETGDLPAESLEAETPAAEEDGNPEETVPSGEDGSSEETAPSGEDGSSEETVPPKEDGDPEETVPPKEGETEEVIPTAMYRLYNPNSGEHFYTADAEEKRMLVRTGWRYEGIGWYAPSYSEVPVYRIYNPNAGDHHYTMSVGEKNYLVRIGWNDEGIGWYSDPAETVPLYREYNPNAVSGAHNYTTAEAEHRYLSGIGWNDEGIGWYALAEGAPQSDRAAGLDEALSHDQLILVEGTGTRAVVSLHEMDEDGVWNETVRTEEGWLGTYGLGKEKQGDRKTPVGAFDLTMAFGIADDPGCAMPYLKVDETHYWCGDNSSPYLDQLVSTEDGIEFDKDASEHLIEYEGVYNYCMHISWNPDAVPYKGSCIFLHCSANKPTAGCVSVPEEIMIEILTRIRSGARIVIDTPENICKY